MSKMDPAGLLPGPEIDSRTATRPLRDIVSEWRMHFGDHILCQLRGRHLEDLLLNAPNGQMSCVCYWEGWVWGAGVGRLCLPFCKSTPLCVKSVLFVLCYLSMSLCLYVCITSFQKTALQHCIIALV